MGGRRKLAEHRLRRGQYPNQEEPHRALGRRRLCRCRPPYARAELRTQNRRLAERGVGGEGGVKLELRLMARACGAHTEPKHAA